MHVDENKKFDKRNIEKNIKNGFISWKDYENFLGGLPDVSEKIYMPGEKIFEAGDEEAGGKEEMSSGRKALKKKTTRPR